MGQVLTGSVLPGLVVFHSSGGQWAISPDLGVLVGSLTSPCSAVPGVPAWGARGNSIPAVTLCPVSRRGLGHVVTVPVTVLQCTGPGDVRKRGCCCRKNSNHPPLPCTEQFNKIRQHEACGRFFPPNHQKVVLYVIKCSCWHKAGCDICSIVSRGAVVMRYVTGKHQELTSNSEVNCAASPSGGLGYSIKPVSVCNHLTIPHGRKKL